MALLLRDREAASEAANPPPGGGASAVAPDFACESCGAGMLRGQDWCLECGTAARGRLGARPGWRAAFTVVGLVLLLVFGAGLAGYAALTSDAERTAAAPTQGNGAPVVSPTPGVPGPVATTITPGETGPGVTPPAITPPAAGTQVPPAAGGAVQTPPATGPKLIIPTPRPVTPAGNQPITPPPVAANQSPSLGTGKTPATQTPATQTPATQKPSATAAAVAPVLIKLQADSAKTYDPGKRAGAEIGPAANAVDGDAKTVWDVTTPADGNPIGVGVYVDLGSPYALQSLRIATNTPGFTAEIYGAVDAKAIPVDVLDKRWQHLTDAKSVADGAPIALKGKGDAPKFQLVLVYVTTPGEPTDPRAAIGELTLRGTP
ncbi:MAG: hypothetical protein QOE11_3011 [Solirubrobacteraceae bacterium]|nr:hypothetical protein [Solirubrobacteraceae bacterium]